MDELGSGLDRGVVEASGQPRLIWEDTVVGLSGISHEITLIRIDGEDLIYIREPVVNELDALKLIMLHIDTGLRVFIDAPVDKVLHEVLAESGALYLGGEEPGPRGHDGDAGAS